MRVCREPFRTRAIPAPERRRRQKWAPEHPHPPGFAPHLLPNGEGGPGRDEQRRANLVVPRRPGRRGLAAAGALSGELAGWAWVAVGALAVAGVFALLLALSRVPGMDKAPFWPIGFFYKGLVIHVVFSLVIWLMGVFAFLVTAATERAGGERLRAAPLGRIGQGVALVAFPCLFAPAFFDATEPELTNYIPLIRHPAYDLGLLLLAAGVLAPVSAPVPQPAWTAAAAAGADARHVGRRSRLSAGARFLRHRRHSPRPRGRAQCSRTTACSGAGGT